MCTVFLSRIARPATSPLPRGTVSPTAVPVEPAPAPPAPAPAPPPAPPSNARVACANYLEVMKAIPYPREALLSNMNGDVVIEFTITANGQIRDAMIKSSTNRVFNRNALNAVQNGGLQCQSGGRDIRVTAEIGFKVN